MRVNVINRDRNDEQRTTFFTPLNPKLFKNSAHNAENIPHEDQFVILSTK